MVGFRNLSLSAKCSEISFLHLSVFFYNFSRETLPKIMPGHKKIHYLLPIKIQNHPLFSTHPVVYMWIFGASPVAWTKSRPEWNAPEKHLQSHLGLLHPSNHNEKVQWQYMKITENHENPKQTMSSVKHFLLPKNKVNLSYRDLLQGSSLISRNPWRFYILIFKGCPGPPNMK